MNLELIIRKQKSYFRTNITKDIMFRKRQLNRLLQAICDKEPEIFDALKSDLNKSQFEVLMAETGVVISEIKAVLALLDKWNRPERKHTPLTHSPGYSFTMKEPYGTVLILSPWNYPFQLAFMPLVSAIAAGNCAVVKASKSCPATAAIIKTIIEELYPLHYIACVDISADYEEILNQTYDMIFFTGSERVGRVIMHAAAEHLTPVVLELGGKSPCIITESADLKLAAKRILFGKLLNAGQTCVAPDYCLIPLSLKAEFLQNLKDQMRQMLPDFLNTVDYPCIVNDFHMKRLIGLIEREAVKTQYEFDMKRRILSPVIFPEATFRSEIMKEEIFGPILPVITYESLEEAVKMVKDRAKPLACYLFGRDKAVLKKLLHEISFGGGCINDTIMHIASHGLPFGGVGNSGMGKYHGIYGLDTFSHEKGVYCASSKIDIPLRYRPYREENSKILRIFYRK